MPPDDVTTCKACGRAILQREADENECCPYCHMVGYTTSCKFCRRALKTFDCPEHGSLFDQLMALKGRHHDESISHDVLYDVRGHRREGIAL